MAAAVSLSQWEIVFAPKNTNDDSNETHESETKPRNFSKQLELINRGMSVDYVVDMLVASFKSVVIHVNRKRIQASEFQRDTEDLL